LPLRKLTEFNGFASRRLVSDTFCTSDHVTVALPRHVKLNSDVQKSGTSICLFPYPSESSNLNSLPALLNSNAERQCGQFVAHPLFSWSTIAFPATRLFSKSLRLPTGVYSRILPREKKNEPEIVTPDSINNSDLAPPARSLTQQHALRLSVRTTRLRVRSASRPAPPESKRLPRTRRPLTEHLREFAL